MGGGLGSTGGVGTDDPSSGRSGEGNAPPSSALAEWSLRPKTRGMDATKTRREEIVIKVRCRLYNKRLYHNMVSQAARGDLGNFRASYSQTDEHTDFGRERTRKHRRWAVSSGP